MYVEEIILQKDGTPLQFSDGSVMCRVITDEGDQQVLRLSKEVLINAGVLAGEDMSSVPQEASCSGESSTALDELEDSTYVEEESLTKQHKIDKENTADSSEWSAANTIFLLDKYAEYMDEVGPMKKFKNKKCMWEKISADFAINMICKSPSQCENRFKTVKKRKTLASTNNNTSGAKRAKVEYKDEMKKIASRDDSIKPEILRSAEKVIINSESKVVQCKPDQKDKLPSVLLHIHNEK